MEGDLTHPADLDGTRKFQAASAGVRSVQFELDALADAFQRTGNSATAETLVSLADDCERLSKLISEAVTDNINVMMQRTNESSHNMLMAAFAVAGIDMSEQPT